MKSIFKHSLKLFLRLLFVHFASFMLAISFAVIFSKSSQWVFYCFTQVFSFLMLITVIWQHIYGIGFKDSNMVRTGHTDKDLAKGFKIGALAQTPFAVLLIASLIVNIRFSFYRMLCSPYFGILSAIAGKDEYMRMGTLKIVGFALVLFIVPVISGVAYILGYNGVDVVSKFIYKKNKG